MTMLSRRAIRLFKKNLPLFNALGDSQRQQILLLLADGKRRSVAELTTETNLSRPAVSHHLKILKDARLLSDHREGVRRYYYPIFRDHLPNMRAFIETLNELDCHIEQREIRK
jgi:ArsR family transcriptional regulator